MKKLCARPYYLHIFLLRLNCLYYSMFLNICLFFLFYPTDLHTFFFFCRPGAWLTVGSHDFFFKMMWILFFWWVSVVIWVEWNHNLKILVNCNGDICFDNRQLTIINNFQDFALLIFTWRDFVVWSGLRTAILALVLEKHWEPLQMFLALHYGFL